MSRTAPRRYWEFHSSRCGTAFRGCAPECPKDIYERTEEWTGPAWPLPDLDFRGIPSPDSPGAFGAVRKYDFHTGVDVPCPVGTTVVPIRRGVVVGVVPFTGPDTDPPSPWWNPTWAVMVEDDREVLLYGEVEPNVSVGDAVSAGESVLGRVLRALKEDKGRPTSMLHLERYRHGARDPVWWHLEQAQPDGLLDPTPVLLGVLEVP